MTRTLLVFTHAKLTEGDKKMSELKLNLVDAQDILHGTIHASVADAAVAALSAEPETIPELVAALARYIRPRDGSTPFACFRSDKQIDAERWDAGILIIDLAARIVAIESSYSQPDREGEVHYHDGTQLTDIPVLYRLPDDWLFVNSPEAYQWARERRANERLAHTPLDVREVLYGDQLLEFIVTECRKIDASAIAANNSATDADPLLLEVISIHSRWLMTPREDLRGDSPRDVLLVKREFIDFDHHTRTLQWTWQGEGPPCLSTESLAYRFAGFGTHEWVIYYDLVRHLIWSAVENVRQTSVCRDRETVDQFTNETAHLNELKTNWLEQPQSDYDGRIPAILIDNERKRLPNALRPRDMIVDEDCPTCQMFGDETSPLGMGVGFWHLDGCNMEDDFPFSTCRTREEWEAENHRREEFNKEFNRKWEEREQRIARGEPLEPDPYFDPEPFDFEADTEVPPIKAKDSATPIVADSILTGSEKEPSDTVQ